MAKSKDYFDGMNAALREVRSVARSNDRASDSAKSEEDRDMFGERARGAAECEQYIMQSIEILGGEPEAEE